MCASKNTNQIRSDPVTQWIDVCHTSEEMDATTTTMVWDEDDVAMEDDPKTDAEVEDDVDDNDTVTP